VQDAVSGWALGNPPEIDAQKKLEARFEKIQNPISSGVHGLKKHDLTLRGEELPHPPQHGRLIVHQHEGLAEKNKIEALPGRRLKRFDGRAVQHDPIFEPVSGDAPGTSCQGIGADIDARNS